jgi:hypothetical protein
MATDYTAYWLATCVRGVIALAAGVTIIFCSELNSTILLLPLGIVLSRLVLSAYVVVDSAVIVASSFMLPHHHLGRVALRIRGAIGMPIGIACFILGQGEADLEWFIYLVALQAASVAIADYLFAREIAEFHNSKWCYAAAGIAALSSIGLLIFHNATGHLLIWVLFGYLWCFGLVLFVLSCHMLYEEHRASRAKVAP